MGITVLLADRVVSVRKTERTLLQKEPDIEVVGEAADEPEAMILIESLEPQIVLTDFDVRSTGRFLPSKSNPNTQGQRFLV
jgi:DNA-binding NarL/FixJ family response regulator